MNVPSPLFNLHQAARDGKLNSVKWGELPESILNGVDAGGRNFISWAAERGFLHQIPKELITTERLSVKTTKQRTAVHEAAWFGHLNQIPQHLLTRALLTVPEISGETPLSEAWTRNTIKQLAVFSEASILQMSKDERLAWGKELHAINVPENDPILGLLERDWATIKLGDWHTL